ncbi:uncharacterized protein METZ01_LOCUS333210, partial [marine metagenome]
EQLVDLFILGNRSFDVDIAAFRRISDGTGIKLYPCVDDHHATDGYLHPPIEVLRGVYSNWWHQGADGIQTFNFEHTLPSRDERVRLLHQQSYREMARPGNLRHMDKTFVLQRRGGGQGSTVVPNPEDWSTPRWMYYITIMLAPLPADLSNDWKADTLLMVYIADDLSPESNAVPAVSIHVLLSDPSAADQPLSGRLQPANIVTSKVHTLETIPPASDIVEYLELRVNNALLDSPSADRGWLVFPARPDQFAIGNNLIGIRVNRRDSERHHPMSIEKLEVHVRYSSDQSRD